VLLVVVVVTLILSSRNAAAAKKRMQGDVEIITLKKALACDMVAKKGDKLAVHYVGKFKDGSVFDKGTYEVGRPQEFTLGDTASFNSMIEGWHMGVEGMCLTETRRLVVPSHLAYGNAAAPEGADAPPQGTLVFDIELISINGSRGAPKDTAASTQYCDSCLLLVERFYEQWTDTVAKQMQKKKKVEQAVGDKPPALTYDEDSEAMVQGFCNSRQVSDGRNPTFLKGACNDLMKGHKREIVGVFLSSTLDRTLLPEKKAKICRDLSQACPAVMEAPPSSKCGRCKAFVDTLAFDLRMQGPLDQAKGLKRQLWDTFEHFCTKMQYRIPKSDKTQELCEDIVDDHGHELEKALKRGDDWPAIRELMCSKLDRHCKTEQLRDEL